MAVLLSRAYAGFAAGTVVQLSAELEASLIVQGFATNSVAPLTAGNQSNTLGSDFALIGISGTIAVPAGQGSPTIFNPRITPASKVFVQITQAAADATFTAISRVAVSAGSAQIFGNANATAITQLSYLIVA
jgi:hypothetical protein